MKTFIFFLLLSLSVFGSELPRAPFVGLASIRFYEGNWELDSRGKAYDPIVEFFLKPSSKEKPIFILNKNQTQYQEFIKEQVRLSRIKTFALHKDYSLLVVLDKKGNYLKLGEGFWMKKRDKYYFPLDGSWFRTTFNAVKMPPKGFYQEPNGKRFIPKITKKMKVRGDSGVATYLDSQTIDGVIWLKFSNYYRGMASDYSGAEWEAWVPAFDSEGSPLFYLIRY